jgi:hypothetical protein
VFHLPTMPEGKTDAKSFAAAVQTYMDIAQAITKGDAVELIGEDGKVLAKLTPTDDIPSLAEKTELKDKDGKVTQTTIAHGQNMPKTLPADYAALLGCLADGIKAYVGSNGRTDITQEFRVGGGQRGRRAAEVDVAKFA